MKRAIIGILLVFGAPILLILVGNPIILAFKVMSILVMLWVFAALVLGIIDAITGSNLFSKWLL